MSKPKKEDKLSATKKKKVTDWALKMQADMADENELLKKEIQRRDRKDKSIGIGEGIITKLGTEILQNKKWNFKLPPVKLGRQSRKKSEEIAVFPLYDLHFGKITDTYSSIVARDRVALYAKKGLRIVDVRRTEARIDEALIILGGDMVEGENIFPHQAHLIDSSLFEQAAKNAPQAIAAFILEILKNFKKVKVSCVIGNHGRNDLRSHPLTNWDRICYQFVQTILAKEIKSGKLEFEISDKFYAVEYCYDWGNLIVHGDQISGGMGGAGLIKKMAGWIDSIPQAWDYMWFGHFHTHASGTWNHRQWFASGTPECNNDYAVRRLAANGVPCQRVAFFNEKLGLISDNPVFLSERVPQRSKRVHV